MQVGLQLDDPARDADRARAVAEVAAHLAGDRRDRERQEVDAARGLEPVDGADQTDRRDLFEVVDVVAAVGEPVGDVVGHRQVAGDQLGAQPGLARVARREPAPLGEQRGEVRVLGTGTDRLVHGARTRSRHGHTLLTCRKAA